MISIIICSRSPALLEKVATNIRDNIGVAYELIAIDNAQGQYGICAAYNKGAEESSYDHLCFMHEDILIRTQDWGQLVMDALKDKTIGLVGATGSDYLVSAPSPWWGGDPSGYRRNVIEQYEDGRSEHVLQNPNNEVLSDVVAVDGLWFCTRKEVWSGHKFDEQTFPGFHGYDVDFSAQIFQDYRIVVTFEILIEHFSRGSFNIGWIDSAIAFSRKWKRKLPMSVSGRQHTTQQQALESRAYISIVGRMLSLGYPRKLTGRFLLRSFLHSPLNRDNFWLLKKYLLNR